METTLDNLPAMLKAKEVFTPNKPINSVELFCGRQDEVGKIQECLVTDGLHMILYGDRGVGKTSLSYITCQILLSRGFIANIYCKTCDSQDTFSSIILHLFYKSNIKCIKNKKEYNSRTFSSSFIGLGKQQENEIAVYSNINSPSWVAEQIEHLNGVYLIDELDVIGDEDKKKIAELIKQLSDKGSKFTIFVVGISKTASDLFGGHPSIQRCVKEIRLDRMSNQELEDIISKGEDRLQISFSREVKRAIINSSAGFPYFTQLLALKSAEEALSKDIVKVSKIEFKIAVQKAVDDMEGSLREKYEQAIVGTKVERNKRILLAAALCGEEIFQASQLKDNYAKITQTTISQQELNNFLTTNIISNAFSTILRRVAKGVYIFNDPRMPSFIKLINNYIEE